MSDDTSGTSPSRARRSSFAGQTFADIFGSRSSMSRPSDAGNSPPSSYPGPITSAAVQAQRRRLSLSTLGLANTNPQSSSLSNQRGRNDSLGSASGSIDECAVEDDVGSKDSSSGTTPSTPFARRVSFGARAMMDIRNSNGANAGQNNGRSSPASASSSSNNHLGRSGSNHGARAPSMGSISAREPKGRGVNEGFNWSENLRSRAERSSNAGLPPANSLPSANAHQRAKSVATMEPPVRESPREQKRPDHFQERILKGDFYMD